MNKYEKLFAEILSQTKAGVLKWKQVSKQSNSEVIFNPNLIWRQFSTEFIREGNVFTLLLVEKKYEDPDYDFAYEKYYPELLVLDEGELIATLGDSIIERADMIALVNLIEAKSDKAKKLFGL